MSFMTQAMIAPTARPLRNEAPDDRTPVRFIVAPEDSAELADLKPFVRDLMRQMEQDLGTRLDWVAADHFNTGHPHSHIVLRGKDDGGEDLVIARDYIAHGLRARATGPRHAGARSRDGNRGRAQAPAGGDRRTVYSP